MAVKKLPPGRAKKARDGKGAQAYDHKEERLLLRPDVGLQPQFKQKRPPKRYRYDPSLDPALSWDINSDRERAEALIAKIENAKDTGEAKIAARELRQMSRPFLNWAGKAERNEFTVPTLPLFVHERLSTQAILQSVKSHKRDRQQTLALFADEELDVADRLLKAYEHETNWVNRLILGDSLAVVNSLLQYEGLGGQVQMIYMDPPYGVKFGSNFQPFIRRRDVKHGDDADLTREPEMVQAYRDTWELGLHTYQIKDSCRAEPRQNPGLNEIRVRPGCLEFQWGQVGGRKVRRPRVGVPAGGGKTRGVPRRARRGAIHPQAIGSRPLRDRPPRRHAATRRAREERTGLDPRPSWRPAPLRPEDLDEQKGPHLTLGTARREEKRGRRGRQRAGDRVTGGGGSVGLRTPSERRGAEQRASVLEVASAGGTPEAVIPHLDTAGREHMREEAVQKLDARERHPAHLVGAVVAIAEGDLAVLDPLQPAIGDRDAEEVAAEVVEHLLPAAGGLAMHDPVLLPHGRWDLFEEPGLLQGRAHLRAEDRRQGLDRHQVGRVLRFEPPCAVAGEPARGDEQMDVGVVQHGPRPGMQHAQAAEAPPEIAGIARKLLQGPGGALHQQAIDSFRVGSRQAAQVLGQGEGQEEVGTGEQVGALLLKPAFSVFPVTLRTGAVAAGVVRIALLAAVIALVHVASEVRGPAGLDIPQGPKLTGRHGRAEASQIRRPVEADDVGHLQHEDLRPRIRGLS